MELKLRQILLYSKDVSLLSSFLSDLFDLEVIPTENGAYLENNFFCFLLKEDKKRRSVKTKETIVDLNVSSIHELHELIKRIEFLNYRLDQEMRNETEIQTDLDFTFFEIHDPDQRVWRFSTKN